MLLASATATAWLITPVRSDVEAKLPADLRYDAWERLQQTAGDDPERIRMVEEFEANRTAALRKLYESAATPEERNELSGPLIKSASYAEAAGAMLLVNGLADPEHHGIAWPGESRKVALRRLHGIGPLRNEDDQERRFAAWRIGHQRVEVVAGDDHLLFDLQGAVVARHSTAPEVDWPDDRPPCFLADGAVMTNEPVPGEDGVARFRCVKDGRTIAECPFIQWQGWRSYHAAYAADGMSLSLWSPGYRGAASGLLEIDGKAPKVTAPPADRIMELWPVGRGDAVDLTENNDFLPLPG